MTFSRLGETLLCFHTWSVAQSEKCSKRVCGHIYFFLRTLSWSSKMKFGKSDKCHTRELTKQWYRTTKTRVPVCGWECVEPVAASEQWSMNWIEFFLRLHRSDNYLTSLVELNKLICLLSSEFFRAFVALLETGGESICLLSYPCITLLKCYFQQGLWSCQFLWINVFN